MAELTSSDKNNIIREMATEIEEKRIQIELDKERISNLKLDIKNLNGGFQVAQRSIINIMQNFNNMFPDYKVEITK